MRIAQASNQLKTPPAKINEAIAQLHQQGHTLFPRDRYDEITPEQLDVIRQYLAAPQQPQQQSGQSTGSSSGMGAVQEIERKYAHAGHATGVRAAAVFVESADQAATHLLLSASVGDIYALNDQLGRDRFDDSAAVQLANALNSLGKPQAVAPSFDFSAANPILAIAGMQPSTQPALSASSESVTEQAGEPSSPSA